MNDARPSVGETYSDTAPFPPQALVLVGHPVSHSLSPRFQQAALDADARQVRYTARDVAPHALADALQELATERAAGNVTVPHKEAVYRACTMRSSIAEQVGAVNTFWHTHDGRLVGHNTDVAGADAAIRAVLRVAAPRQSQSQLQLQLQSQSQSTLTGDSTQPLRHIGSPTGAREHQQQRPLCVALLGAGGSAAACIAALRLWNVRELIVAARTIERAETLIRRTRDSSIASARAVHDPLDAVRDADLIVNATPIGLSSDDFPVAPEALPAHAAVLDLVYRPGETAWVRACRTRGHRAEDGLRMLVEQGAAAYIAWFGSPPDRAAMWAALEPRPSDA